ncbi:MAG: hypothetical protein WC375_06880 [Methanomassiliicoccales archaeon]
MNRFIQEEFDKRKEVKNLTSVPGKGMFSAMVIFAEIGDVREDSQTPSISAPTPG